MYIIVKKKVTDVKVNKLQTNRFFNGYVQTYAERDVRSLINLKNPGRFQQFLPLIAGRIGQLVKCEGGAILFNDDQKSTIRGVKIMNIFHDSIESLLK